MNICVQINGSELWKKVGFKPSEKVLFSLRGVYNLPFNLDDPVASSVVVAEQWQWESVLTN